MYKIFVNIILLELGLDFFRSDVLNYYTIQIQIPQEVKIK
jgi:hypothetical protein